MPLSPPVADRQHLHTRRLVIEGYERPDGLFDIEGHLTDTKPYAFDNFDRGRVEAGEPLHGMWIRLTVDEEMVIRACEAVSDYTPYAICPAVAANFARLAGVRIGPGFNRAVKERVGGVEGCTHLREMLAQMATVAFQTMHPRRRRLRAEQAEDATRPAIIGTCHAYAPDSPVVARQWPAFAAAWRAQQERAKAGTEQAQTDTAG
jgi:hypothetical protein